MPWGSAGSNDFDIAGTKCLVSHDYEIVSVKSLKGVVKNQPEKKVRIVVRKCKKCGHEQSMMMRGDLRKANRK